MASPIEDLKNENWGTGWSEEEQESQIPRILKPSGISISSKEHYRLSISKKKKLSKSVNIFVLFIDKNISKLCICYKY